MLRVPQLYQPRGTPYCGAACLQMVLAYYDGRITRIQDIVKELPMMKSGLYPALAKFLHNGGNVSPRLTTVNELWGSLVAGVPPILNVDAGVWRRLYSKKWRRDRNRARTAGHYVVLTDTDAKTMTLNDPSRLNGGKLVLPTELVMHALYSWGAAVIFAKPLTLIKSRGLVFWAGPAILRA